MQDNDPAPFFAIFTDIGIIDQLVRALLEARLPKGLITSHFTVLNHLIRVADGRTPMELARAFQVPKTSMTHTLAGLEKHRLVAVRPNPNDGRSKCVWLTEKGRRMRDDTIAAMAPEFRQLAAGFEMNKLKEIAPVLKELREYLDNHRNAEPPRDRDIAPRGGQV